MQPPQVRCDPKPSPSQQENPCREDRHQNDLPNIGGEPEKKAATLHEENENWEPNHRSDHQSSKLLVFATSSERDIPNESLKPKPDSGSDHGCGDEYKGVSHRFVAERPGSP